MKPVKVYSTAGELEAEMIKGFLEAQGIKVMLVQESIGRTLGLAAGTLGEVKVFVPGNQAAAAHELLAEMEAGDFTDNTFPNPEDEEENSDNQNKI